VRVVRLGVRTGRFSEPGTGFGAIKSLGIFTGLPYQETVH
jgi:hypothetical protein